MRRIETYLLLLSAITPDYMTRTLKTAMYCIALVLATQM